MQSLYTEILYIYVRHKQLNAKALKNNFYTTYTLSTYFTREIIKDFEPSEFI